jgi:hypothetical protein
MTGTMILLDKIVADPQAQPRAELDQELVAEYAEAMEGGAKFPPVVVFQDGDATNWLADGFHRLEAARASGLKEIEAEVRRGSLREAILFSVGANATHGKRRTNQDKRRAVSKLLADKEWSAWSDNKIAQHTGVSQPFVSSLRKESSYNGYKMDPASSSPAGAGQEHGRDDQQSEDPPAPPDVRKVERNGSVYEMAVNRIGKATATPEVVDQGSEDPDHEEQADEDVEAEESSDSGLRDEPSKGVLGRCGITDLFTQAAKVKANLKKKIKAAKTIEDLEHLQKAVDDLQHKIVDALGVRRLKYNLKRQILRSLWITGRNNPSTAPKDVHLESIPQPTCEEANA